MIAVEATENGEDIDVALARYPESFFVESTEELDWEKISSGVGSLSLVPLVFWLTFCWYVDGETNGR